MLCCRTDFANPKNTANDDLVKDFFIRDIIHLVRAEEVSEDQFDREDFEVRMKMLKTKCAHK